MTLKRYHEEVFLGIAPFKYVVLLGEEWYYPNLDSGRLGDELFTHFSDKKKFNTSVKFFEDSEKELIKASKGADYKLLNKKLHKYIPAIIVIFCEDQIRDHTLSLLEKKSDKKTVKLLIDMLNSPLKPNFYKQEEYDLVTNEDLEAHVSEYGWILSRYGVIDEYTVEKAREKKEKLDKKEFLKKWNHAQETTKEAIGRAKEILGSEDSHFVDVMQWLVWFRTQRTDVIAKATYLFFNGYKKLAESLGLSYEDLLYVSTKETLDGNIPSLEEIAERKKGFTFYISDGKQGVLSGGYHKAAVKYMTPDISGVTKLSGTNAFKGNISGVVRIIKRKEDFEKVEEGDVLVTSMTTPVMVPIMKKAAGFVTDEGGITCHAAVIARELKKPCIIGTGHATQVLKDGDMVEVDADKGVVRIINKKDAQDSDPRWYSKYSWESLAQDINSPFIRNFIWVDAITLYKTELRLPKLIIGIKCSKNDIEYIGDTESWKVAHNEIKKRAEEDSNYVERELIDKTNTIGTAFNKWSEKHIFNIDLVVLEDDELVGLYNDFLKKQSLMYAYGTTIPILDFAGFSYVEKNLEKILREKISSNLYNEYYSTFTEPLHDSFAQVQEKDLLKLIEKYETNATWCTDVKQLSDSKIKEKYSKFWKDLEIHTEKHCWVYYVYQGPAFDTSDFLEFIQEHLNSGEEASEKLVRQDKKKKEINRKREEYIKQLVLNEFEEMIVRLAGKMVWAKPRRKDYQSRSYYHFEKLLKEIARRTNSNLDTVRLLHPDRLKESLEKQSINTALTESAQELHVILPNYDDGVDVYIGEEAQEFCKNIIRSEEKIVKTDTVGGNTAFPGKVCGVVRVINRPEEMDKMSTGDILVSVATTPSIVPVMKKSAAIITDEGGLTCHAAIVSRELEIPCIVGTKIATQVLKDGDMVEVDAGKGIVKIINKKKHE